MLGLADDLIVEAIGTKAMILTPSLLSRVSLQP
jgi:hypothetical protein